MSFFYQMREPSKEKDNAGSAANDDRQAVDEALDALIEQDKTAKLLDASALEYTKNISVYEGDNIRKHSANRRSAEALRKNAENIVLVPFHLSDITERKFKRIIERLNALPVRAFAMLYAVLIVFIAGSGLFLISNIHRMTTAPDAAVIQPKTARNSANFIFLKQSKQLGGNHVMLTKMVADSLATVFYFDTYLDAQKYQMTLSDNNNEIYATDPSFWDTQAHDSGKAAVSVIRFSPLAEGVTSFILRIRDMLTEETAAYTVHLKAPIIFAPVKYANEPIDVFNDDAGLQAKIYGAEFSASGSVVYFGFSADSRGETISLLQTKGKSGITMTEAGIALHPAKAFPSLYTFEEENQTVGRMDFAPVKNLNRKITLTFDSLFKEIKLPESTVADTAGLFRNTAETAQRIPVGDFDIVLERMGIVGDSCLLVLHSESKSAIDPVTKQPERMEVRLDTELVIKKFDGSEVTIAGKARSIKEGTDIVYDVGDILSDIIALPYDNFTVKIKSAQFKLEDVSVDIDLSGENRQVSDQKANAPALHSIQRLLVAKSISAAGDSKARYSARLIAYAKEGARIHAVVADTAQYRTTTGKERHDTHTHKIIADYTENGWTIKSDAIL